MKAIAISEFGDSNVFKEIDINKPTIKSGHILVKVKATSINPLDIKLCNGSYANLVPTFPMILQGDVAGIVEEISEDVTKFKVGDEVYGCAGGLLNMQGALAEFMLVDANLMAHKPKSLSFHEAAALPLVSLTVWEALIRKVNLQKNQTILIHGGTGGVGHIAIQFSKYLGANVFATSLDEKKLTIAKKLGADGVINYKTTTPEQYVKTFTDNNGFDVVFDTVGGENMHICMQTVKAYGQIVCILPATSFDAKTAFSKNLSMHFVFQPLPLITGVNRAHYGEILQKMAELVDQGIIKPLVDERQFSMKNVGEAYNYLEKGQAIGKVVIAGF